MCPFCKNCFIYYLRTEGDIEIYKCEDCGELIERPVGFGGY